MCGEGSSHHWPVPTSAHLITQLLFCYISVFLHYGGYISYFTLFLLYICIYYVHILGSFIKGYRSVHSKMKAKHTVLCFLSLLSISLLYYRNICPCPDALIPYDNQRPPVSLKNNKKNTLADFCIASRSYNYQLGRKLTHGSSERMRHQ